MATTKKKIRYRRRRSRPKLRRRLRPLTKAQVAAGIRRALKPQHSVLCYYGGFNLALDSALRKLAGRPGDSGFALFLGLRDLEFYYATAAKAAAAAAKIKAARLRDRDGKLVRVMMRGFWKA
jgi:hypothetical protein